MVDEIRWILKDLTKLIEFEQYENLNRAFFGEEKEYFDWVILKLHKYRKWKIIHQFVKSVWKDKYDTLSKWQQNKLKELKNI